MASLLALPARIQNKIAPDPNGGCWLWTGAMYVGGYGHVWNGKGFGSAHRYVYELLVGQIPEGLSLDHLCRVRSCVNPGHLEPVTQRVNILRGESFSARYAKRTHCPRGHELSGSNLYKDAEGARTCRECERARGRQRYAGGYRSPSWLRVRGRNV